MRNKKFRLSKEDENRLVKLAQAGDRRAMHLLVSAHRGLIYKAAEAVNKKHPVCIIDDLEIAAMEGWTDGIKRFNDAFGVKLSSYAIHWARRWAQEEALINRNEISVHTNITGLLNDAVKQVKGAKTKKDKLYAEENLESVYQQIPVYVNIDNGLEGKTIDLPIPSVEYEHSIEEILESNGCDDREIKIIKMYADGLTLTQIGELMWLTRERVRQIKDKARDHFTGKDFMFRRKIRA